MIVSLLRPERNVSRDPSAVNPYLKTANCACEGVVVDLFEAILGRRSIRSYHKKDVPEEFLNKLLEMARWAPSAGNLQPWEIVVVRAGEKKRELAAAAGHQYFIAEAPIVLVMCANIPRSASRYGRRGETLYCIQDVAAAIQNVLLSAHALGLGTCWVGAFDEGWAGRALGLPRHTRPLAIVPLGYPAKKPSPRPRRPLNHFVHNEQF